MTNAYKSSPERADALDPLRRPGRDAAPGPRALAKQNTRDKLLKAARQLFMEQGYEGATIRDIAAAAGMSTGAVFANFNEKFDLFREIASADLVRLTESMAAGAQGRRDIDDALLGLFSAGYNFYLEQLPLARATFSVGWSREEGRELRQIMPRKAIVDIVIGVLNEAVAQGELAANAEVNLRGHMLCDAYAANFRQAIFDGWKLEPLRAHMRDQIRVILAGARPT